jgi:heat shock protein HslJ
MRPQSRYIGGPILAYPAAIGWWGPARGPLLGAAKYRQPPLGALVQGPERWLVYLWTKLLTTAMTRFFALLLPLGMSLSSCAPKTTSPALSAAAPATASTPDPAQLRGSWRVQSLRGQALPAPADPQAAAQLTFDVAQGRVSGFTGCNRLFGSYTATGTQLRLAPLGTTRMACPAPNPETELLVALQTPDLTYQLSATELTLLQGTTPLVVLRRTDK